MVHNARICSVMLHFISLHMWCSSCSLQPVVCTVMHLTGWWRQVLRDQCRQCGSWSKNLAKPRLCRFVRQLWMCPEMLGVHNSSISKATDKNFQCSVLTSHILHLEVQYGQIWQISTQHSEEKTSASVVNHTSVTEPTGFYLAHYMRYLLFISFLDRFIKSTNQLSVNVDTSRPGITYSSQQVPVLMKSEGRLQSLNIMMLTTTDLMAANYNNYYT